MSENQDQSELDKEFEKLTKEAKLTIKTKGEGDKTIKINASPEDLKTFSQMMKRQNEINQELVDENIRLKEENAAKEEPNRLKLPESAYTATLNRAQLGLPPEESDFDLNSVLPLHMKEYAFVEDMITDLRRIAKSDSEEAEEASKVLDKLALKAVKFSNREPLRFDVDPEQLRVPKKFDLRSFILISMFFG